MTSVGHRTGERRAIGLDIGGTKIAGAVVREDGTVIAELTRPTPEHSDTTTTGKTLLGITERLHADHPEVLAIGVGAAGLVEWPHGLIRWAPNSAYRDWPVRVELEDATGLPTVVDNDANVAALAEARLGACRLRDMVLLTVGTGVGGGVLLGGRIYRGPTGRGAELGHMVVDPDGPRCGCGNHGCLEALASGTALTRMGRDAAADDPDGLIATLARDEPGGTVTGETVTRAARQGDPTAQALFTRLGRWLGVGIASLANIFELEAVVIGGGLVETGDLLLAPARAAAREFAYAPGVRGVVPIGPATFGAEAGVVGAALLGLEHAASSRPGRHAGTP
ncbi:ROK family protein [Pseudonocardia asaccharolytica]|uniref:Glucokinase n=1 Tax=Pseudonocardia asaccharolytica DSM 44247 = NBRC 16224 TaxID=1123024 RepID=A0A511D492_9PSEU|nr:ROK family protein [Pseudonocardia asaccharolytica]GEL17728.1 glucokinase [Pseudonocardia asaccharolytica DSM 44247 = NBRC 16224]